MSRTIHQDTRNDTVRNDMDFTMENLPVMNRKDEANYGDCRTGPVILEIYDAMADAMRTGHPYQTRFDPPAADPRCCHPPKEVQAP